jgi:hypothetical protein
VTAGDGVASESIELEMRFEPLDVTPEHLLAGLRLWDTPLQAFTATFKDAVRNIFEAPPHLWQVPSIFVTQILLETTPSGPGFDPAQVVRSRVSIIGFGWEPGSPVLTKWNNAIGFPDNGVGANSILLQSPVPDSGGRFGFQVIHTTVKRPSKDWLWGDNIQLVLVAQQHLGTPNKVEASQRYIPGHVLWQWVP